MNSTPQATTSGSHARSSRPGKGYWPLIIIGLLSINVTVVTITIIAARNTRPPFADQREDVRSAEQIKQDAGQRGKNKAL
jgi:hypothetical protein